MAVVVAAAIATVAAADATAGSSFVSELTAKKGNQSGCPFFVISQRYHRPHFPWRDFSPPVRAAWNCFLSDELRQLKAEKIHAVGGGVQFGGDFFLCYRVNLESRIASRVLWQVAQRDYRSEDDIYRTAYAPRWTDWFDPARTIRVDISATKSPLTSLNFVTLKIKDAVCDKIRRISGRRPNVDTREPDIPIQGHLSDREFTLYLDTTGEPLFKRGQRIATGEAPLRENLAAGIIRLAGWTPGIPLLDPMCGSGTILVEAAHMALDIAPGLGRGFAFEKFKNFDSRLWRDLLRQSRARQKPRVPLAIYGSDLVGRCIESGAAPISWQPV